MSHKEKLERLKANRGAHRGAVTKVAKEVEKILGPIEHTASSETAAASRLNILRLTTLYNACAVPWGVFSTVGDVMMHVGGYHVYRGVPLLY